MSYFEAFWIDLVYLSLFIIFSILIWFHYCCTYWQRKHVPYIPASFPFGNLAKLTLNKESFGDTFQNLYNHFRQRGVNYGGFYMLHRPCLVITDLELIKTIVNKEFSSFHDQMGFADEKVNPLGLNLFVSKGEQWRNLRKKSSPTFTSGKLKMMFNNILKATDDLTYALDQPAQTSEPVMIKETVAKLFIDVIGTCVFGIECNSLKNEDNDVYRYGRKFLHSFLNDNTTFILAACFHKINKFFKIRQISTDVTDFFVGVIKDTIETREGQKRNDFMDLFVEMRNNKDIDDENISSKVANTTSNTVTFNELAAMTLVFLTAGFEASSQTLTFCLYELALNKLIQDKLREEIIDTVNKCGKQITYEAITEMEYLDKILKETLRKYPSTPIINRICTIPYKMPDNNLIIEKDVLIWISVLGLHNDPEYYPNPDKFDPERFSSDEKMKRHPYAYLPFGEGPRQCIGMRFANLQMKLALIFLLKTYTFSLDPKTSVPLKLGSGGFLLYSETEVYLQVSKNVY